MLNLYWKSKGETTRSLIDKPFETETKLEEYVFHNPDLLEDIFILKRQIKTGAHQGIPDMIGVDQDGAICILEVKNAQVTEDILPQVLGYAIWAGSNPDSVKALWLQAAERPEGIEIDWDNPDIKIIIVAPSYRASVLRMTPKVGYPIDLMQIRRFAIEDEEFLLVEKLEEQVRPVKETKGLEDYDQAFYEKHRGKKAVQTFFGAVRAIEAFVKGRGWRLETKFNKYYAGFKYGYRNCFGVHWSATHVWVLFFKVPRDCVQDLKWQGWELQRYEDEWKQAIIRCHNPQNPNIQELAGLFDAAYEYVTGSGQA